MVRYSLNPKKHNLMKNLANSTINSVSKKTMHKIEYDFNIIKIGDHSFSPNKRVMREDRWGFLFSVSLDQELKEVFGCEMEDSVLRSFNSNYFLYSRLREKIEGLV